MPQPSAFMVMLPWAITGIIILIGGVAASMSKLPWQTKAEAKLIHEATLAEIKITREADLAAEKLRRDNYDLQIASILKIQATTVDNCAKNAEQIGQLTTAVAVIQSQLENRSHAARRKPKQAA